MIEMDIIEACHAAFKSRPDVDVNEIDYDGFSLTARDGSLYVITMENEVEENLEDIGEGTVLDSSRYNRQLFETSFSLDDASDILDVCIAAMATTTDICKIISDFATFEDDDREVSAVFKVTQVGDENLNGYLSLRVTC